MKTVIVIICVLWCGLASAVCYAMGRKEGLQEGVWESLCDVFPHAEKIHLSENGKAWLIDMDGIRLIADACTLEVVGWYRPDVDPEVEALKARLDTVKTQFEYVMEHPEDRCLFCAHRDEECGSNCEPEYMDGCDSCG